MRLLHINLAVSCCVSGTLLVATPAWVERETFLMGTTLTLGVAAPDRDAALLATDSALAAVRQVDDLINDWRPDSELGRFNRSEPGTHVPLSQPLAGLLREVHHWTLATGGAVDPSIGSLVDAWDLRGKGRLVPGPELQLALAASGKGGIETADDFLTARRLDQSAWVDAGSFGKGAALRSAQRALHRQGVRASILNFGGQVSVQGDTTVMVAVAHPRHRQDPVLHLHLRNASASTTGQSERRVVVGGVELGHVLDPRNGSPVPAWGSVTVVHPDPMIADLLSTALFVMGPKQGLAWAAGQEIAALFLEIEAGQVVQLATPSMQSFLVPVHSN